MLDTRSPNENTDYGATVLQQVRERAWNALIPASAIKAEVLHHHGVRYLHPTKGWKYVGKKRFAIRGVM